jgi:hypothetical protein
VLLALTMACSAPTERTIVGDFFAASRLRDLTALSRFSTVVFEPHERGTVSSFRIERVSSEEAANGVRTKQVQVTALVLQPDGRAADKSLIVKLQKREGDSRTLYNGWLVTGVTEAVANPASRRP